MHILKKLFLVLIFYKIQILNSQIYDTSKFVEYDSIIEIASKSLENNFIQNYNLTLFDTIKYEKYIFIRGKNLIVPITKISDKKRGKVRFILKNFSQPFLDTLITNKNSVINIFSTEELFLKINLSELLKLIEYNKEVLSFEVIIPEGVYYMTIENMFLYFIFITDMTINKNIRFMPIDYDELIKYTDMNQKIIIINYLKNLNIYFNKYPPNSE